MPNNISLPLEFLNDQDRTLALKLLSMMYPKPNLRCLEPKCMNRRGISLTNIPVGPIVVLDSFCTEHMRIAYHVKQMSKL